MSTNRANLPLSSSTFSNDVISTIKNYIDQNKKWFWKNDGVKRARAYLTNLNKLSQTGVTENTIKDSIVHDYLLTTRQEGPLASSTVLRDKVGEVLRNHLVFNRAESAGQVLSDGFFQEQVRNQMISTAMTTPQSEASVRFDITAALLQNMLGYAIPKPVSSIPLTNRV